MGEPRNEFRNFYEIPDGCDNLKCPVVKYSQWSWLLRTGFVPLALVIAIINFQVHKLPSISHACEPPLPSVQGPVIFIYYENM
jgi:hypothetical protein